MHTFLFEGENQITDCALSFKSPETYNKCRHVSLMQVKISKKN